MIKLNENIIRWIIAVPCILLTVCLVLYRHTHDFAQRHIHIHVFQVVHPRAADPDMVDHLLFPLLSLLLF